MKILLYDRCDSLPFMGVAGAKSEVVFFEEAIGDYFLGEKQKSKFKDTDLFNCILGLQKVFEGSDKMLTHVSIGKVTSDKKTIEMTENIWIQITTDTGKFNDESNPNDYDAFKNQDMALMTYLLKQEGKEFTIDDWCSFFEINIRNFVKTIEEMKEKALENYNDAIHLFDTVSQVLPSSISDK